MFVWITATELYLYDDVWCCTIFRRKKYISYCKVAYNILLLWVRVEREDGENSLAQKIIVAPFAYMLSKFLTI